MGDVDRIVGKFQRTGQALQDSSRAMSAAGMAAKLAFLAAPGAPHRVANKTTTVRYRNVGKDTISVRWTGPAHLVDKPTRPHEIRARSFVGTRGTGRRAQRGAGLLAAFGLDAHTGHGGLRLTDGNIRSVVHHPGTRGKHFFAIGKQMAIPMAARAFRQQKLAEIEGAFRG